MESLRTALLVMCLATCERAPTARVRSPAPPADSDATPVLARALPADTADCEVPRQLLARLSTLRWTPTTTGPFPSPRWATEDARAACLVQKTGHYADSTRSEFDSLLSWLREAGWREALRYGADGPDGSTAGLYWNGVTCLVTGTWDGGDDSDPTYVPSDTLTVAARCTRTAAADTSLPPHTSGQLPHQGRDISRNGLIGGLPW